VKVYLDKPTHYATDTPLEYGIRLTAETMSEMGMLVELSEIMKKSVRCQGRITGTISYLWIFIPVNEKQWQLGDFGLIGNDTDRET
jgi:hypothetical protein